MMHPDAARLAFALGPAGPPPTPPDTIDAALSRVWPQRERWAAWRARSSVHALLEDTSRQLVALEHLGGTAVFAEASLFPAAFKRATSPPAVLFCQGDLRILQHAKTIVAIVGSRAAFRRELEMATAVATEAAAMGCTIVSGGAIGIDTAAHQGTLTAGGKTAVILGSGLDDLYPPRNRALFSRVIEHGGLLLTPFALGTAPRRSHFPARNALVAVASALVVVVAAAARSGALSTARHAMKLGIPVAAFPGTQGCDVLLAKGQARPLRRADDLGALLTGERTAMDESLMPIQREVLEALSMRASSAAMLSTSLQRPLPEMSSTLLELELDGHVVRGAGGIYCPL
ncbi:MAG: DNA-protecting protein DprA [Deltaproteobacteria bacterium]|nr:DNA-protecting protein DprA [Deltaproteobacteria bacterium]